MFALSDRLEGQDGRAPAGHFVDIRREVYGAFHMARICRQREFSWSPPPPAMMGLSVGMWEGASRALISRKRRATASSTARRIWAGWVLAVMPEMVILASFRPSRATFAAQKGQNRQTVAVWPQRSCIAQQGWKHLCSAMFPAARQRESRRR